MRLANWTLVRKKVIESCNQANEKILSAHARPLATGSVQTEFKYTSRDEPFSLLPDIFARNPVLPVPFISIVYFEHVFSPFGCVATVKF